MKNEDVVYMASLTAKDANENIREKYKLNLKKIKSMKKDSIILSPLPRIDEISKEVDSTPNARYFQQSKLLPTKVGSIIRR